jgi:NADH-quinone oxidoreductase subunit L
MSIFELIWLIPGLPLAGFILLIFGGSRLGRKWTQIIGVGSVGASAVIAVFEATGFLQSPPGGAFTINIGRWISSGLLKVDIAFYFDALSVVMTLVITVVSLLILLYSGEFMAEEEGYGRFFAYMDLFVGMMLLLVLANNLLLLYLGWEGVGLCSYLLIGFWYRDPANIRAAHKAFIITRIGDTALIIGIVILAAAYGTLDIQPVMTAAGNTCATGSTMANIAAALILAGALGKSAQMPLHTWLPDAMAGPSPVSALIHSATMVTAGIYLIARTHVLFLLAPSVMTATGVIGAVTLLVSAGAALAQINIKKVLAYSTISQIGYMFLALGVGAWSAAIFHFVTHAFFKSLLFLGAGVVSKSLNHELDMFKMGGLKKEMPIVFWTFLAGAASLAALPIVTAGFYSKDLILSSVWSVDNGAMWLWAAGSLGAFLTGLYSFRMVFLTFFGKLKRKPDRIFGLRITAPLIILAVFSLCIGFINLPSSLWNVPSLTGFLKTALPEKTFFTVPFPKKEFLDLNSSMLAIAGLLLAYFLYVRKPWIPAKMDTSSSTRGIRRFLLSGWGFDGLYDWLFVRPFMGLAYLIRNDLIDAIYRVVSFAVNDFGIIIGLTQNGSLRWYTASIALGAAIIIWIGVFA